MWVARLTDKQLEVLKALQAANEPPEGFLAAGASSFHRTGEILWTVTRDFL